jgi:hypothetical protein
MCRTGALLPVQQYASSSSPASCTLSQGNLQQIPMGHLYVGAFRGLDWEVISCMAHLFVAHQQLIQHAALFLVAI